MESPASSSDEKAYEMVQKLKRLKNELQGGEPTDEQLAAISPSAEIRASYNAIRWRSNAVVD